MNLRADQRGASKVAVVESDRVLIQDTQDALDLMATVRYQVEADKLILFKQNLVESFFDLSTRLAGDILQKYTNYSMIIAIVGDFSTYSSKSFKDFIYECNNGKHVFFLPDEQTALEKLHSLS
ncbi:DUF4180 domain-containing protein [Paenibacillus koleovorans]|uniref:DUF4180 domain-containing protein n=1 Tax=Paenibacillus koleovorans TaxID=121608 RepID=UPI000FDA0F71|nr:DUF4180 domain-containing protein [Paenibacillus koleovorans]